MDYITGSDGKKFSIKPEEWDFSGCPKRERMECCLYEYARSSEAFREHYEQQKSEVIAGSNPPIGPGELAKYYVALPSGFGLSMNCPEFPTTPWLRIDAQFRRKRVMRLLTLRDASFTVAYPEFAPRFSEETGEEVGLFEICWGCPQAQIVEDFRKWVNANHKAKQARITGKDAIWPERPVKSALGMLNSLGAWRLLQQMTQKEAWVHTSDHRKNEKPLFNNQQAWSRAKRKAEVFLGIVSGRE